MEAELVEEPQQPRSSRFEAARRVPPVPHLHRAPDELIPARAFHPVHAQVRAADADRVLRRPRARRVVLGRHEPVARVHRGRNRRAEVDVAETEHEVARVEHDAADVVDRIEAVDAADELEVARAPRRVGPRTDRW